MKTEFHWLSPATVLAIHDQAVAEHGGAPDLRDLGLLESALAAPRHRDSYGKADVHVLAAAYAFAITRNHPFVDGNKRVAFMAAYTFLGDNGYSLEAPIADAASMTLGLADHSIGLDEFATWLREYAVAIARPKPRKRERKTKLNGKASRRKRDSDRS